MGTRKSDTPVKNPKGAIKKALKTAQDRGAKATPAGTKHVSKTPRDGGLGR